MVQDIADDDWLLRPELAPSFGALIEHGLVFDALVLPRHLARLARLRRPNPSAHDVAPHGDPPGNEVDVLPPEPEQLALSKSRTEGDEDHRLPFVPPGRDQAFGLLPHDV